MGCRYIVFIIMRKLKLSADPPRDATPRIHGSGLAALRHYAPGGTLRLTDEHLRREGATLCAPVFAVNLEVAYVYINVCLSP